MVKNLFSSTRTREVLTVSRNQLIMLNLIETRFLVLLAFRAEMLSPEFLPSWSFRNLENDLKRVRLSEFLGQLKRLLKGEYLLD